MSTTALPPFDPANVQGDILVGLPKRVQHYILFQIVDVDEFRKRLGLLIPHITTTTQVMDDRAKIAANKSAAQEVGKIPDLLKLSGINIAFSHSGLLKLGITDDIGDSAFAAGQLADSKNLGDPGKMEGNTFVPDWLPVFKQTIHGVVLISGDCDLTVTATQAVVDGIFTIGALDAPMIQLDVIVGTVRPGAEKGHEHFGFMDGISQPAVKDFNIKPNPGQETVSQGVNVDNPSCLGCRRKLPRFPLPLPISPRV